MHIYPAGKEYEEAWVNIKIYMFGILEQFART